MTSTFQCISIFLIILNAQVQGQILGGEEQYLHIWASSGCSGDPQWSFTEELAILQFQNEGGGGTVYYKVNGLWEIKLCGESSCISRHIATGDGTFCSTFPTSGSTKLDIKRFGDGNQQEPKIHLFHQENYAGNSVIVDETGGLDSPKMVMSYFFTGPFNWTTVSLSGGVESCTKAAPVVVRNGYGITQSPSTTTWTLSDVRFGCGTTTTTDPTEEPPYIITVPTSTSTTTTQRTITVATTTVTGHTSTSTTMATSTTSPTTVPTPTTSTEVPTTSGTTENSDSSEGSVPSRGFKVTGEVKFFILGLFALCEMS